MHRALLLALLLSMAVIVGTATSAVAKDVAMVKLRDGAPAATHDRPSRTTPRTPVKRGVAKAQPTKRTSKVTTTKRTSKVTAKKRRPTVIAKKRTPAVTKKKPREIRPMVP